MTGAKFSLQLVSRVRIVFVIFGLTPFKLQRLNVTLQPRRSAVHLRARDIERIILESRHFNHCEYPADEATARRGSPVVERTAATVRNRISLSSVPVT